jgi:hypothetical protein
MQTIEQIADSIISLELRVSMINRNIDHLTREINDHRRWLSKTPLRSAAGRAKNAWRRRSFELHRRRSEMKSERDLLISSISSIRDLLEPESRSGTVN